jgi:hypothetical protein
VSATPTAQVFDACISLSATRRGVSDAFIRSCPLLRQDTFACDGGRVPGRRDQSSRAEGCDCCVQAAAASVRDRNVRPRRSISVQSETGNDSGAGLIRGMFEVPERGRTLPWTDSDPGERHGRARGRRRRGMPAPTTQPSAIGSAIRRRIKPMTLSWSRREDGDTVDRRDGRPLSRSRRRTSRQDLWCRGVANGQVRSGIRDLKDRRF